MYLGVDLMACGAWEKSPEAAEGVGPLGRGAGAPEAAAAAAAAAARRLAVRAAALPLKAPSHSVADPRLQRFFRTCQPTNPTLTPFPRVKRKLSNTNKAIHSSNYTQQRKMPIFESIGPGLVTQVMKTSWCEHKYKSEKNYLWAVNDKKLGPTANFMRSVRRLSRLISPKSQRLFFFQNFVFYV